MKQLPQIAELYIRGFGFFLAIPAAGTTFILIKLSAAKFIKHEWWKARKEKLHIESDVWAIE